MPGFKVKIFDEDGTTKVEVTFPDDFSWKKIDSLMDSLDCSEEMRNVCKVSDNRNSTKIILPKGDNKTAFIVFKNPVTQTAREDLIEAFMPTFSKRGKLPFHFSERDIIALLEAKEHKYFPPEDSKQADDKPPLATSEKDKKKGPSSIFKPWRS